MQVVNQLEIHLQKERDRLHAMMQHLHLTKQLSVVANMTVAAAAALKQRDYGMTTPKGHRVVGDNYLKEDSISSGKDYRMETIEKGDLSQSLLDGRQNKNPADDCISKGELLIEKEERRMAEAEEIDESGGKEDEDVKFKLEDSSYGDPNPFQNGQYFLQKLSKINPLLQSGGAHFKQSPPRDSFEIKEEKTSPMKMNSGDETISPNMNPINYNEQNFLNYHQNLLNLNSTIRKAAAAVASHQQNQPILAATLPNDGAHQTTPVSHAGPIRRRITDKSSLSLAGGKSNSI